MQTVTRDLLLQKACELLDAGTVNWVYGWQKGQFDYDVTPAVFSSKEELEKDFVYNDFCGPNLSK